MFKLQLSKEIKGASKMLPSELRTELVKEMDFFKDFTDEEISNEIESNFIRIDGDTVEVWFEEF